MLPPLNKYIVFFGIKSRDIGKKKNNCSGYFQGGVDQGGQENVQKKDNRKSIAFVLCGCGG